MPETIAREEALDWVLEKLSAAKTPRAPSFPKVTEQQKQEALKEKRPKEVELWKTYKSSGWHPDHLEPLIKSFSGLIASRVNLYKNRVEVPTSTIEAEHHKWFAKGLKSYDPTKGANLATHLTRVMKKAGRWIEANKNWAYIPENVSKNIGAFNAFKSDLTERLGYEPDDRTVHDFAVKEQHPKLGVLQLRDIKRLNKDQRKGLIRTGFEQDPFDSGEVDPREVEVAHLIIPHLTAEERVVHEYTLGLNGKPRLKPGEIAKKVKMDNSKVAKLRTSIWNKMKPHLG
jgi:DNA-directed RNA polymerase specialized sigma subunit